MAPRKKRKPAIPNSTLKRKIARTFVKPAGIRVEDIKTGTVFEFTLDGKKETHLAMRNTYDVVSKASLQTWLLQGHERAPCLDVLPSEVDWDYTIKILGLVNTADVAKKIIRASKRGTSDVKTQKKT